MDLDQLKAFVLVTQKGSLTHAAKSLGLTTSAISLRLKGLEAEIGLQLFDRKPNKVLTTETGKLFANQISHLLKDLENAVESVRSEEVNTQKNIFIAMGVDTAHLLGSALARFVKDKTRVRLSLLTRRPSETLDMVMDDRADLGIGRFSNIPKQLVSVDLFLPRRLVAISPKNASNLGPRQLSIHELASHPIIAMPQRSRTRSLLDQTFAKHGLEMRVAIEAGGCTNIKQFVKLGLGVGLIHDVCASKEERQSEFQIRDLNHIFGEWRTTLIYKKSSPLSSIHRELIDKILEALRTRRNKRTLSFNYGA